MGDLRILGFPDPTPTLVQTLCLERTVDKERPGLCARMHSPFSQYELQTLCKSEIVGLDYLYNSAFPILSVPKISRSHALARTCTSVSTKSSSRLREVRRHHIPCRICRHRFRMCVPSLNGLDKSSLTNSGCDFYAPAYFFLIYEAYLYFKIPLGLITGELFGPECQGSLDSFAELFTLCIICTTSCDCKILTSSPLL